MSDEPAAAASVNADLTMRLSAALWAALLAEVRDEAGVATLPMPEVLGAMAMLGGVLLSTWPGAKVPSKLRARCNAVGQEMALRARQAIAEPQIASMFTVVPPKGEVH